MNLKERLAQYLREEPDELLRKEIESLAQQARLDPEKADLLQERLFGELKFGTAGFRAPMQAGFSRMNRVFVAKVGFALAQYLHTLDSSAQGLAQGVVVGYDARLNSAVFAQDLRAILSAFGFVVHGFRESVATPLCAFAVPFLKARAGIMVTASHNPPMDNGLKIYWSDGAQVLAPHDSAIEVLLESAPEYAQIARTENPEKINWIDDPIVSAYFAGVMAQCLHPNQGSHALRTVYTPLHGVGAKFVREAFKLASLPEPLVVPEQQEEDGRFPTLAFPNPEEEHALDLAIKTAEDHGAELILANDPDADRMAACVKDKVSGLWRVLSGNEIGMILAADALEYAAGDRQKLVITTLVSTRMLSHMAEACQASYAESLTGFSRIARVWSEREEQYSEEFVFGFEEAIGYQIGGLVKDKDGISAAVRFAERAAHLNAQGQTLFDELDRLSLLYGVFRQRAGAIRFEGAHAQQRINEQMRLVREQLKGGSLGGLAVSCQDFLIAPPSNQPPANLLLVQLPEDVRLVLRPSGTEPKLKYYLEAFGGKPLSRSTLWAERNRLDRLLIETEKRLKQLFGSIK